MGEAAACGDVSPGERFLAPGDRAVAAPPLAPAPRARRGVPDRPQSLTRQPDPPVGHLLDPGIGRRAHLRAFLGGQLDGLLDADQHHVLHGSSTALIMISRAVPPGCYRPRAAGMDASPRREPRAPPR